MVKNVPPSTPLTKDKVMTKLQSHAKTSQKEMNILLILYDMSKEQIMN
jgi:hypothetical protein